MREGNAVRFAFRERFVARAPRRRLEALAALYDLHFLNLQRHAEALAQAAAERRPGVRIRTQAVVDMNCRYSSVLAEEVEKNYRIDAAGKADGNTRPTARSLP